MKKYFTKIRLILLSAWLLSSCDAVKRVGADQFLLTKNTVEVDGEENTDPIVQSLLSQHPNARGLGMPIGLYLYNLAEEHPDSLFLQKLEENPKRKRRLEKRLSKKQVQAVAMSKKKRHEWIKKMGEAPVIIRTDRTERSRKKLEDYYKSLGWLNTRVEYEVVPNEEKEKRAEVVYHVSRYRPYIIDSIDYQFASPVIDSLYEGRWRQRSPLKKGNQYNLNDLTYERERINFLLRNRGMFNFNQEYVRYVVDTVNTGHKANVEYIVAHNETEKDPFKIHKISEVKVITDYSYENRNRPLTDSIFYDGTTYYGYDKIKFKPKALANAISFEADKVYRDRDRTLTYSQLNNLKVFRYPNIGFMEDPADSTGTNMLANILLTPRKKLALGMNVDATTSPIQVYGIGFNSSLLMRNVFRGAENLEIVAHGSVGTSRDATLSSEQLFNISEIGSDVKLSFPRMVFPVSLESVIPTSMSPTTMLSAGFNSQHNIGLDKQNLTAALNYNWKPSRIHTFRVDLMNIQYVRNLNVDNYFNVYRSAYRRLNEVALSNNISPDISYFTLDENNFPIGLSVPAGTQAFLNDFWEGDLPDLTPEQHQTLRNIRKQNRRLSENNLILSSNVQWIRDSRRGTMDNQFTRTRFKLEVAGNILRSLAGLVNTPQNDEGKYEILDIAFSQYTKFEAEYIRYWELSRNSVLATRWFGGLALPYGNSGNIPFARSYFAGGPNDNRGWSPFRLGPGASPYGDQFNEANLKLALNFEYRYTLLRSFKGAFFIDAGNIWNAFDDVEDRPATFEHWTDLKNIAVASGFGLRYDFGFFVFRVDAGFKTYNPARPEGQRWFKEYNFANYELNIGVNYPF